MGMIKNDYYGVVKCLKQMSIQKWSEDLPWNLW